MRCVRLLNEIETMQKKFPWVLFEKKKKTYEMESASASLIDFEKAWPAPYAASKCKLPT